MSRYPRINLPGEYVHRVFKAVGKPVMRKEFEQWALTEGGFEPADVIKDVHGCYINDFMNGVAIGYDAGRESAVKEAQPMVRRMLIDALKEQLKAGHIMNPEAAFEMARKWIVK